MISIPSPGCNVKTVIATTIKFTIKDISIQLIYHFLVLTFSLSLSRININNNIKYIIPTIKVNNRLTNILSL